ncbi:MAG: Rrf2 family transcriptional regulator [Myxococcales bacterium]|nr:Rrf2 family transcriptional regulator [Myxococcales bacterium]
MLKLNKKTEYALMALQYMSQRPLDYRSSAREIAQSGNIPDVLLAKVLQSLKRASILSSCQGSLGGYYLARNLSDVPFLELLEVFEDSTSLVDCMFEVEPHCSQYDLCGIRSPLKRLNDLLRKQLQTWSVNDILHFDRCPTCPGTIQPLSDGQRE